MRERLTLDARDQRRIDVLARWGAGQITVTEAAALFGCSERTAWRLRRRFASSGVDGIVHGNRGRASPRRTPPAIRERIVELALTRYRGVNDSHLADLLAEDEDLVIGRSSLQRLLRDAGVGTTRTRRTPKYRSRRERMPQAGLLVQIDGSPHDWLEGRGPRLTLVGAIDDATGAIVGATFAAHEDGRAYLTILARMCRTHGVPVALYRDRSGIFAPTRPGGSLGDAGTQVGRAFAELGIASVAAASPQAKGRVERLWGTCQDRLVSELRLAWPRPTTSTAPTSSWSGTSIGSTPGSACRPPSSSRPGDRPRRPTISSGSVPSAGGGSSATTTPSGSRGRSSRSHRPTAGAVSPDGGSRWNSGSMAGSSSSIGTARCSSCPCRPTRAISPDRRSARLAVRFCPGPARGRDTCPGPIIPGTARAPKRRAAED